MRREDIYTVENGLLVLNREYLRGLPEFRCIFERNLPVKGDSSGRKKIEQWRLFMYIKLVADLFCYPSQQGLNEKETHLSAIKDSGLNVDFKPDEEIKEAIKRYREIQIGQLPILKHISTALKSIKLSDVICETIIKNIEKQLEIYNKKIEAADGVENIADSVLLVNNLIDQLSQIQKIALGIPKMQETLEKLDERLKKESSGDVIGRGGKSIGNRAEPNRQ